jgi:hypothetical protein
MSSWTRCSSERAAIIGLAAALLAGCSHAPRRVEPRWDGDGTRPLRVAMFPVHDLAGAPDGAEPLTQALEEAFAHAGVEIVSEAAAESSLGRRRFRWVGGLDAAAARAVREDLGVDAVVLTALEAYAPGPAPLLSVSVRLVSVAAEPRILWADGFSKSGDDWRGLLGIGAVKDPGKLRRRAASALGRSLARFLRRAPAEARCPPAKPFDPRLVHETPLRPGRLRVAVLPFLNRTNHENAGEVLALEFLGQLAAADRFEVLDPGIVRTVLLEQRIIIRGGVSFDEATRVLDALDADLVLSGEVRDFEQAAGLQGTPRVEFTARLMDRDRNVVWQSLSQASGVDAVSLFDFGTVRTATGLACRMAAGVVTRLRAIAPEATAGAQGRRPRRRTARARSGALAPPCRLAQRLRAGGAGTGPIAPNSVGNHRRFRA